MSGAPDLAGFDKKLADLNASAIRLGRCQAIEEALKKLETMAPVIAEGDLPLNPGQVMAYRRAKRQMAAILFAMMPPQQTTEGKKA